MPPPPRNNRNRKSRPRQTTLKFSSPLAPSSGSGSRSTAVFPSSPTQPRSSKPAQPQPRDAFQAIMPNSSPVPRRTKAKSTAIITSDYSDSEESTSVSWRSGHGKRKRGMIGIAESRSGVSAGFFGAGLSRGRVRKIRVKSEEESDYEEEEGEDSDIPMAVKKNVKSIAREDEEDQDEKLKKAIREKKVQRRLKQGPVLENIRVASSQVDSGTPTKKLTLVDESDEGEESAQERRLKDFIRERKTRGRKSAGDAVAVDEEQLESKKGRKSKRTKDAKSKNKGKGKGKQEVIRVESDAEEDDIIILPTSSRGRRKPGKDVATPKKRSHITTNEEGDEEDDVEDDVRPAGKRGKFKHTPLKGAVGEEDEDRQALAKSSSPQVTQAMKDKVKGWMIESEDDEQKNDSKDIWGHKAAVEDSDEDEDIEKENGARSGVDERHNPGYIPKRRRKPPPISDLNSNDDDDDLPVITPSRRRRLKSAGQSSPPPADDDSDLGSDTELAARTPVLESRTRYGDFAKKLTPYQRKLKQLKAKREGVELVSSDDEIKPRRALYDSDDGQDNLEEDEEEISEDVTQEDEDEDLIESEIHELESPLRQKSPRRRNGGLDSDIDSFIVTDSDSDPLGAPDDLNEPSGPIARIPIQFTSQSHASLKIHFKTVVQYILNLLLNPAFPKDDEYFTFALHAIDRKVDSFRDSVLKSEAWKSDFMRALKSRPGFEFDPNGGDGFEDHCMACNRRDRNASYTVRFTGRRYDPETFEDYSSEDEDDSEESEDELGNVIPRSGTSFPVGRYCYERAEITHSFWHWKKGLRTALEEVLIQMGVFEEDVIRKVEGMRKKERWKWVDGKLGDLEKGGDVELLWDMFNAQMKRAEEFMGRPKRYFLGR